MAKNILAIDQGTTSSRAIIFAPDGRVLAKSQREFKQYYPDNGWVEHDPEEIWQVTSEVCCEALSQLINPGNVAGIGITNQRETTLLWDKRTGTPVYPAIVWQDRRTAQFCRDLFSKGHEDSIRAKTGLCLDAYFSATKIHWILENIDGVRADAEAGNILAGTIDSWLIWKFTQGRVHATDATNASRTLLFNIHNQCWDSDLLKLFDIPESVLPQVHDSAAMFGVATEGLAGREIPITGVAGDQQAAMVGQACLKRGMVKSTYGTGCFALMNLGGDALVSENRLLTTIAYRIGGQTTYALEGAIFVAGAAVQWLRDNLGIIQHASETEDLAASLDSNGNVYLVPAFTGLGAPHWQPDARAILTGLTRASGKAEIARAALEAVCYQTRDLFTAMASDAGSAPDQLRVDGGMVANNWMLQALADITEIPVLRPTMIETSALGAARLAALALGIYGDLEELASAWQLDRKCSPQMTAEELAKNLKGWERAVKSCELLARS